MKGTKRTLALAAALVLGLSAVASADDHRGRGYRDGDRQTHAAPRRGDSRFRAQRRTVKRGVHRRNDRHGHYRDGSKYRQDDRRSDWRRGKQWRGGKFARKYWRQHQRAREHRRTYRRQDYRAARRHRHGNRICYSNHGYERSAFSIWLDGVGFIIAD